MRLPSFLEAPEPSRAEERSQYQYRILQHYLRSIALQFGIALAKPSKRIALLISSVIVLPRARYLSGAIALLRFLRLPIELLAVIDTPLDYCTASDCLRAALNAKSLRFSSDREC
ncbi:hypothetical protein QUA20_03685 [Microcoleus sp. Pol7_A1]|uniref:hypothetical protein n=1 Tax=Microcoleus sp. Pol7_A1 TaxID=2818893 RepID=UPI002FD41F44